MRAAGYLDGVSGLVLLLTQLALGTAPNVDLVPILPNASQHGKVVSAGQPTEAQIATVRDSGVAVVINLRTPKEMKFDERKAVEKLGMTYVEIPVAGAAGLTPENVEKLHRALEAAKGKKVLLHCGSANRVGALMALRAKRYEKKSAAEAMKIGKAWGLSKLAPVVEEKLRGR